MTIVESTDGCNYKTWALAALVAGSAIAAAAVGFHWSSDVGRNKPASGTTPPVSPAPSPQEPAPTPSAPAPAPAAPAPEPVSPMPVAYRAALLIEAPERTEKVETILGNVTWALHDAGDDGPAVEADVALPDAKAKVRIVFSKNTDASLPATHTIKVSFDAEPGSPLRKVGQISVPQMRDEGNPSGEALAGVTVPVVQNVFLIGLSPGSAESSNLRLLTSKAWIDVPILLGNKKIAKLTFEKGATGQRDIDQAVAAWAAK